VALALELLGTGLGRPLAVVSNRQPHAAGLRCDRYFDAARAGVAADIREAFLERAEQRELRLLGERRERARRLQRDANAAVRAEIGHERAKGGEQAEVVEQRRAEGVRHAADALDPGIDQRERPAQPLGVVRADSVAEYAQLHLDGGKDLRRLVVQLAREPPALVLVLRDHPGGEPRQLDGAGLEPGVEIGVLERGAHLLAQGDEEPVVQSRERVARVAHQHERADDFVAPEERKRRRVGVRGPGCAPRAGHLRAAGLQDADEGRRGVLVKLGAAPPFAYSRAAHQPRLSLIVEVEGAAPDRGERQWPRQQGCEDILFAIGGLQIARERGQRAEPSAKVVQHEQQDAGANGQREQDIEVIPPGRPGTPGAKERVIQVVQAPEAKRDGQQRGAAGRDPSPVAVEHPSSPQRRQTQERHRRPHRPGEVVESIDRDVRPHGWEEDHRQIPRPPPDPLGEDERGGEQRQRGPAGDDLVPVEPNAIRGEQEAGDRTDAEQIESPGDGPPGEVGLPVPLEQERAEQDQRTRDGGLEQRGVELEVVGGRKYLLDHGAQYQPIGFSSRLMNTCFVSRYSSTPQCPSSRPNPDALYPPQGASTKVGCM
jgi:hypothetical protein